jgi:PAS domain S-box-containing protein
MMQGRITRLRNEINGVADPARLRVTEIQLDLALEASQRRGYLLTGDEELARQFAVSRARRREAEQQLIAYARRLDKPGLSQLARSAARIRDLDSGLDSLVSSSASGPVSAASLLDQRHHFLGIQALGDSVSAAIDSAAQARRTAIGDTESIVARLTAVLVLFGLGAASLVARLGWRFRAVALRLDESEERFRQIAENLSDVVWLSDPELRRQLYVNRAYERIWGRSRESLEANPSSFLESVHPDDRARAGTALADVAHGIADVEFRVVRPDGEVRWVWSRGFPVHNADGRVFRVAGIIEDITERRQHAQERERLLESERDAREVAERRQRELERVTESRAKLVRGFTHDVKNPLGAADGFLALLQEGVFGGMADKQQAAITKIRRSIRHALELIGQVLEIARAEAGLLEIHAHQTDVVELVREATDAFQAQARAKDLSLTVDLPDGLPTVDTDSTRLRQVIGNLVSNAVKYTPRGGHVAVHLGTPFDVAEKKPKELVIEVSDDGLGIPDDKLPMLFTEFTRFDPGAAEGAGIGLAISQKIAQALGGEITVDSRVGGGTTFAVHLPIAADGSM